MKSARIISTLIVLAVIGAICGLSIAYREFFFAFFASIAAVLVLVLAIGATVSSYLLIDNHRKSMSDLVYRLLFFVLLFVIGFAVRLTCAIVVNAGNGDTDVIASLGRGVQTLYFTIAGIGFEGQDISVEGIMTSTQLWCTVIYFGSMLWLAASYIIIITAGVSYGAYSFFLRLWYCRFGRRSEYYVFTTLSEDALNLADSIQKEKGDKAFIIFCGDGLEQFDAGNELHRKVKIRKFPYVVLGKKQYLKAMTELRFTSRFNKITFSSRSRHNSVLLELGLLSRARLKNCSFHVFSLLNDEDERGLESTNSDNVYDDIQGNLYDKRFFKRVLRKYLIEDEDNPYFHIDYYVLTNNSINYEFYSKNFRRIYSNYERDLNNAARIYLENLASKNKKPTKEVEKDLKDIHDNVINAELKNLFKINLVNEAYLAGLSLIEKRHLVESQRIKGCGEINYSGVEGDNDHVAIFLGFGQTGQTALCNLFIDTTTVNKGKNELETGEPPRFIAHVYDENITDYAGQFEKNHPSFLISDLDEEERVDGELLDYINSHEKLESGDLKDFNKLLNEYKENREHIHFSNEESLRKYYKDYNFDEIDKYLKFPHIFLHCRNCNSLSLLRSLDSNTGTQTKIPSEWKKANSIVIALGDDELNIMTANAILQDIRQELYSSYDYEKEKYNYVDIYVNIRNNKNRHRLNWNTELERAIHPNINVLPFGDSDDMYSFKTLIDNLKIELVNANYGLTSASSENFEFVRDRKLNDTTLGDVEKKYHETISIMDTLLTIEGFVSSIRRKDFNQYHEELTNAYLKLVELELGKISDKDLINTALTRRYDRILEVVDSNSFKGVRGKWKVNKELKEPLLNYFKDFASKMNFDEYVSTIVPLSTLALLKNVGEGKYLLNLDLFKSFYPTTYHAISNRKIREVTLNRKKIAMSRQPGKEFNGDLLFRDIAKTKRSFYLDQYSTDSTRYLLSFVNYYEAYFTRKDKDGNILEPKDIKIDYTERNFLAQLEHARWARYMCARGTVFTSQIDNPTNYDGIMDESYIARFTNFDDKTYTKQFIKLHKDLVPYEVHKGSFPGTYLGEWLEIYDYINALIAKFICEEDVKE